MYHTSNILISFELYFCTINDIHPFIHKLFYHCIQYFFAGDNGIPQILPKPILLLHVPIVQIAHPIVSINTGFKLLSINFQIAI